MRWSLDEPFPLESNGVYIGAIILGVGIIVAAIVTTSNYLARIPSASKGKRRSGCSCPLDESQLGVCSVFLVESAVFYGPISLSCLDIYNDSPIVMGYWTLVLLLLSLFIYLEIKDPAASQHTDPLPIACYCEECGDWYQGRFRKHCYRFDHHCHYINQCVGRENYKPWLLFILVAFFAALVQEIMTVHAVIYAFTPSSECQRNVDQYLGFHFFFALAIGSFVILGLGIFALGSLVYEQIKVNLVSRKYGGAFVSSFMWWGNSYKQEHHVEVLHQALLNWRYMIHQRVILTFHRKYKEAKKGGYAEKDYQMEVQLPDNSKTLPSVLSRHIFSLVFELETVHESVFLVVSAEIADDDGQTYKLIHAYDYEHAAENEGLLDIAGKGDFQVSAYQAAPKLNRDFWLMNATLSGYLTWSDIEACSKCVEWPLSEKECKWMISLPSLLSSDVNQNGDVKKKKNDGDKKGNEKKSQFSQFGLGQKGEGGKQHHGLLKSPPYIEIVPEDDQQLVQEGGDYRRLMDMTQPIKITRRELQNVFQWLSSSSSSSSSAQLLSAKKIEQLQITPKSWKRALRRFSLNPQIQEEIQGIHAAYPSCGVLVVHSCPLTQGLNYFNPLPSHLSDPYERPGIYDLVGHGQ
eukprot:jgi/Bigna1/89189/estExt_fgenesh1_pg.C_450054